MVNVQTSVKMRKDSLLMPDDLEGTYVEHSLTLKDGILERTIDVDPAK